MALIRLQIFEFKRSVFLFKRTLIFIYFFFNFSIYSRQPTNFTYPQLTNDQPDKLDSNWQTNLIGGIVKTDQINFHKEAACTFDLLFDFLFPDQTASVI